MVGDGGGDGHAVFEQRGFVDEYPGAGIFLVKRGAPAVGVHVGVGAHEVVKLLGEVVRHGRFAPLALHHGEDVEHVDVVERRMLTA